MAFDVLGATIENKASFMTLLIFSETDSLSSIFLS